MINILTISDGTPRNTKKKSSVPLKNGSILLFRNYTSIYGTQEHWNTHYDKSRTSFFVYAILKVLNFSVFLKFKILNLVFQCSSCSIVDNQKLICVPVRVPEVSQ